MGRAYQNRKESMAKTSDMKAKVYSKYGREIYVCAKDGGVDPDGNLALRRLIDKAKKDQVPTHVIDKAIDKAKGGGGENFETVRYEGFGPGGVMVIVDCLTDNNNRTFAEVRQCFTKTKSKIGTQGTVAHMFDHSAIFQFKGEDEEATLDALVAADTDVTDIECNDGIITVLTPANEYFKAKTALQDAMPDIQFETDEISFLPQSGKVINGEDLEMFEKFLDMLDYCDDVQHVYHNAEIEE